MILIIASVMIIIVSPCMGSLWYNSVVIMWANVAWGLWWVGGGFERCQVGVSFQSGHPNGSTVEYYHMYREGTHI